MAGFLPRVQFLGDLRARIRSHVAQVETTFVELDDGQLAWKPSPKEWSILECFEHLVLTYDYYRPRLARALEDPVRLPQGADGAYAQSRWGRFYMYFALNPRYSFPTASVITPASNADRTIFAGYLERETELLALLEQLGGLDLQKTRIPVEKGVTFNLGDVLKILVYHDEVHFLQAQRVLEQSPAAA